MSKKKAKVEKSNSTKEQEQFIKQVQEEARREAIHNFIEKYWKQGLTLIVSIVIIGIISISISAYQKSKNIKYASELHSIIIMLETNKYNEVEKDLIKLFENKNVPNEVRAIAGMYLANLLNQQQKSEKAMEIYSDVRKVTQDSFIAEVATLMKINLMIRSNNSKYDEEIKKLLVNSIKPENTLNFLAREQKLIFDLNNALKKEAKETYNDSKLMDSTINSMERIEQIYESYITTN